MSEADALELAVLARLGLTADGPATREPGEGLLDALAREARLTRAQVLAARSWLQRHVAPCACGRRWLRDSRCPACDAQVEGAAPAAAARAPLGPGQRVGALELVEELGRGAAGVVYRARHTDFGREVALKVVQVDGDPRRRRR
ncbi:MAG: hypothetical protein VKI81_12370, partial [Synechococcaceae cyanobacterium]|nr:hypothetical protein [Synechococcaceae cyanobacterium]